MEKPKNKAKSLKLGKNDIICPSCNTVLNITEELKDDELIQCTKCEVAISNPLFFSGKFVLCQYCGNNAELPRNIENELIIYCTVCNQDIYNPHSDKCNLITCPHCNIATHVPDEIINERQLQCSNCMNDFKNTLYQKKNINIEKQNHDNSKIKQNSTFDNNEVDEQLTLTKQQKNWLIGIAFIVFLIIIISGILYEPKGIHNKKPTKYIIEKYEEVRSPEIIYYEMKKALSNNLPVDCILLYKELQTEYPYSTLLNSAENIYDSALYIIQLKKNKEVSKQKSNYKVNNTKKMANKKSNKHLKVYAQAYSDGILSCNVYLVDRSGDMLYLDASSITYSIYNIHNARIKPTGQSTTSNTNNGLFIDIPLGSNIFEAKSISFDIKTKKGITYKSNSTSIDY